MSEAMVCQPFVRTIFFLTLFIPSTILISLSVLLLGLFPGTEPWLQRLEVWWAQIAVFASGMEIQADIAALDSQSAYIFVANHQSHLDIPLILSLFPQYFPRALAKESLFRIPIFGPGMRRTGHLPIDRENRRRGLQHIHAAAQKAQEGVSILIFPEGSRNIDTERLQEFQVGAFIIALLSGVPIVPIVLDGTNAILPKGSWRVQKGVVRVRGLKPLSQSERYTLKDREQLKKDVSGMMEKTYSELHSWREKQII